MSDNDSDDATAQGDDQSAGDGGGAADADETPGDDPAGLTRASDARSADGGAAVGGESDRDDRSAGGPGGSADGRDVVGYVQWAAFAILCLLALVATFRFYFAASEAIRVWFSPDFVPVFQAVFNLVVLAASAVGISVLVRRIA
ncbi:hypothetical protein [Halosimplex halophilum]|uniref:hypothetical protein n=1 Tax=Halosimplex halophilum TaxID=2559572 RepID=UPI00107EFCFF|nr:hypothetical protein [Halosimplex halophilum]